jgi:ElaB/YqjD/DUF883 family membrane-anchored ribosome-binding protein
MLKSKIKSGRNAISKDVIETLNKLKKTLGDGSAGVKGHAGELVSDLLVELNDKKANYKENIEDYVSEKPLKSLGFAIAIGFVLAKIL